MQAGNVSQLFVSFQGEGLHAGRRQLFVRFGGCPLRCRYCDEPESLVPVAACRILGPDGERERPNPFTGPEIEAEIAGLVDAAPPLHAMAVTGGEPLQQAEFLSAWLGARERRLPVLLETAGILPGRLARVLPWVEIVSLDIKCPSNTGERARWDEHEACLRLAVGAGREVYVKMPVDEGTSHEEVERGSRLVAGVDPTVPLFLTPLTEPGSSRLTIRAGTLDRLHAVASRHHPDVRALRKMFDLYANVRPVRTLPGVRGAFAGVDLIVVRENTEDLYSGIEHQIAPGVVESVKVITARASRRIAEYAFQLARRERRRKVVAIHKANIMKLSDGLFLACARQVALRYPRIKYEELIVDNACMQLVRRPAEFDVLVLENLYGDIVSDLCAGLVGGLGLVPGANVGKRHALFEAVHGTAPDIAGKNLANPLAAIMSGAKLLRHVGQKQAAGRIERAVERLLRQGRVRTRDLGGRATTRAVTEGLIALLH